MFISCMVEQKPSGVEMDETWKSSSLNSISMYINRVQ